MPVMRSETKSTTWGFVKSWRLPSIELSIKVDKYTVCKHRQNNCKVADLARQIETVTMDTFDGFAFIAAVRTSMELKRRHLSFSNSLFHLGYSSSHLRRSSACQTDSLIEMNTMQFAAPATLFAAPTILLAALNT